MTVPDNIRTQFDTSAINTSANTTEESHRDSIYGDVDYVKHTPDPRSVNVAEKVSTGITHTPLDDDYMKAHQIPKVEDYVKKTDAPGYADILTKTEAASTYAPVTSEI